MYRNISYFYGQNYKGHIRLYTWDESGNPVIKEVPHQSYCTYGVQYDSKRKSIFDTNVDRKYFDNKRHRDNFVEENSGLQIFEAFKPEIEYLRSAYRDSYESPDFAQHPLRIHYLDLELAVQDKFPYPKDAECPINIITLYDSYRKKYFCWTLGNVVPVEGYDMEVFCFDNELHMIKSYITWLNNGNFPDVVSTWNGLKFDIPYIFRRVENIQDEEGLANRLSPEGKYFISEDKYTGELRVYVKGYSQLDYLLLYRDKFLFRCPGQFSLGEVGLHELKKGKLKFKDGAFKDQWKLDFQRYFEYNVRDVEILVLLEQKLELIAMTRMICNFGLVPYESIYSSIPYLVNSLSLYAKREYGQVFPCFSKKGVAKKEDYEGGYVKDPIVGFYRNGVATIDLNSLYPNTMIALNLSPETKVGRVRESGLQQWELKTSTGKFIQLNEQQYQDLRSRFTVAKNGTLFIPSTKKLGIVSGYLRLFYDRRVKNKGLLKKRKLELSKAEAEGNSTRAAELEVECRRLKGFDNAFKVYLNSIYGILGTNYSPIYDVDMAEAITLTDQFIIKELSSYINQYFSEKYGANSSVAIYSDTDSVFIDISDLIKSVLSERGVNSFAVAKKSDVSAICKRLDAFINEDVNSYCSSLACKELNTTDGNRIEFKREALAREAAFFCKKRYILHIINDEGNDCDTFKYTGVEVQKNEFPATVKGILREVYERTCKENWQEADFIARIKELWQEFRQLDWEGVSKYVGYGTERKAKGFMDPEGGTYGSNATNRYNQLLEKYGLLDKYEEIRVGDRIRICYIHKNEYGISYIGFKNSFPEEFKPLFSVDYATMFSKMVSKPLSEWCNLLGWRNFDPTEDTQVDIFSLGTI